MKQQETSNSIKALLPDERSLHLQRIYKQHMHLAIMNCVNAVRDDLWRAALARAGKSQADEGQEPDEVRAWIEFADNAAFDLPYPIYQPSE